MRDTELLKRVELCEEPAAVPARALAGEVHPVPEIGADEVPRGVVVLSSELRAFDADEAPRRVDTW